MAKVTRSEAEESAALGLKERRAQLALELFYLTFDLFSAHDK